MKRGRTIAAGRGSREWRTTKAENENKRVGGQEAGQQERRTQYFWDTRVLCCKFDKFWLLLKERKVCVLDCTFLICSENRPQTLGSFQKCLGRVNCRRIIFFSDLQFTTCTPRTSPGTVTSTSRCRDVSIQCRGPARCLRLLSLQKARCRSVGSAAPYLSVIEKNPLVSLRAYTENCFHYVCSATAWVWRLQLVANISSAPVSLQWVCKLCKFFD